MIAAPGQSFMINADFGTAPTTPQYALFNSAGSAAIAYTSAGISSVDGAVYEAVFTVPVTEGFYTPMWKATGVTPFADEVLWVTSSVAIQAVDVNASEGGSVDSLLFTIKRNDTLPKLRRRLVDGDGQPINLNTASVVKFTMRLASDTAMNQPAKIHASATILDPPSAGIVEYAWQTGDTDTATTGGSPYNGEFEVTYADGSIQTFPSAEGQYITITIPRDLDPGVTP